MCPSLVLHEQQENIADWEKVLNPGVAEVVRGRMHLCTFPKWPRGKGRGGGSACEGSVHAKSHQLSQSRFPLFDGARGRGEGNEPSGVSLFLLLMCFHCQSVNS